MIPKPLVPPSLSSNPALVPSFSPSTSLSLRQPFFPDSLTVPPLTLYQHLPLPSSLASACPSPAPSLSWTLCSASGTLLAKITQLCFCTLWQSYPLSCLWVTPSFILLHFGQTLHLVPSHYLLEGGLLLYFSEKPRPSCMYFNFSSPFLIIILILTYLYILWLVISESFFPTTANLFTWALDDIYLLRHGLSLWFFSPRLSCIKKYSIFITVPPF